MNENEKLINYIRHLSAEINKGMERSLLEKRLKKVRSLIDKYFDDR